MDSQTRLSQAEQTMTKSNMNHTEEVERDNAYIMARMHPAVMLPGFLIGFMVIAGCLFKGYMGW